MSGARYRVGILGATGSVGQKLIGLLAEHPWFEVTAVAASERSEGKRYSEAVHWLEPEAVPEAIGRLTVQPARPPLDCDLVFSALGTAPATEAEPAFARAGYPVVSNAGAFRMAPDVPLLIPDINPEHVAMISRQGYHPDGHGYIVTNPNCSTTGLVGALKPLDDAFGVESVLTTTMQAVSGAGYPGVPSLDILGNVVPFIGNEEEKLEAEPRKILGSVDASGKLVEAPIAVSAHANRVPVIDGHFLTVSARLRIPATPEAAIAALRAYEGPLRGLGLPTAPARVIEVHTRPDHPQPRLHAGRGGGMVIGVGRVRPCPLFGLRFVALVHNTLRGAAGGTVLNAELLVDRGLVVRR